MAWLIFITSFLILLYMFPAWTLGILFAAGLLAVIFYLAAQNSKKQKAKAAAAAAAELENARRAALTETAKRCLSFIRETVLAPSLVVDSNIWMNEDYDNFFAVLRRCVREKSDQLVLYGPQFDEMCNIKRKADYGEDRNRRARLAINRIEALQKEDLLRIEPVTIDPDRSAYADPMIVKLLVAHAKRAKNLCFVSDDKELRIRVREHLRRAAPDRFSIIEGTELLDDCAKVIEAEKLQLIAKGA